MALFPFLLAARCLMANDAPRPAELSPSEASLQVFPWQRILLKGDSIAKGYGFGNYTDPSPLRTIPGIVALLFKDNLSRAPLFETASWIWNGFYPDGTPKTVDNMADEIRGNVKRGDLRTGDWLVFEDAGQYDMTVHPAPWPAKGDFYNGLREGLRSLVQGVEPTIGREHILLMTMFDYNPVCPTCAWDEVLDDGVHTANDAVRDEARALGVRVIDMNAVMDDAHEYLQKNGWGRPVGPDGIHPNVYGNYVMALAILRALGANLESWRLDTLVRRFKHPESGGDVETVWGFSKNPSDTEREKILFDLRRIVLARMDAGGLICNDENSRLPKESAHGFRRITRHGRVLSRPARQPEGTSKPVVYEVGKIYQLDPDHCLLVASMREEGGHDFAVGNDGFVFARLSDIDSKQAVPINRLEPNYRLKSGETGVQAKYPGSGGFVPMGAKLVDGRPHPAAGTGFLFSATGTYLPDRSEAHPRADNWLEMIQLRWDGKALQVLERMRVEELLGMPMKNVALSVFLPQDQGFLCPVVTTNSGIVVIRFDWNGQRWTPSASGKPFVTAGSRIVGNQWIQPVESHRYAEIEPSIWKDGDRYMIYTRGSDPRGRVYTSTDGLNYTLLFDHQNHTVPQVVSQGLDGSCYLATNTGPGMLRNPLIALALKGQSFVEPIIVHDENGVRNDKGPEVPFCDHAVGTNVRLEGMWRHLLCYRLCDLRETNGQGAPPTPNTGVYIAEMEYDEVKTVPFRF